MKELYLPPELSREVTAIYEAMASRYTEVASKIPLTCQGCPDNCCDSYFLHYTYSEWAYLWEGLRQLADHLFKEVIERSRQYVTAARASLMRGERPRIMCPLNKKGLCGLYQHRMMICRMHGVPALLTRPDQRTIAFPGCFRCQKIVKGRYADPADAPAMDRTLLYQRLAHVESRLLGRHHQQLPRIKLTIAEMIINGPPQIASTPHQEAVRYP
ncbi:MAG: hypothetical protein CSA21_01665 [Deltaproteobacteria bacterium]|nr:MAG: hypothetical protein CSA21_01665 [Deltaproteobacteria bacterium]